MCCMYVYYIYVCVLQVSRDPKDPTRDHSRSRVNSNNRAGWAMQPRSPPGNPNPLEMDIKPLRVTNLYHFCKHSPSLTLSLSLKP
ncbi:hypothetical protein HanLR1_Chr14g0511091 [Helianthus annuus]|nr:hypothetical protein HanHA89_Chr14g0541841 [Helianthus annuus]KAJ0654792.1 hypothetical protein HanLR1_Chr14g0511091 [Helianthus annuus]